MRKGAASQEWSYLVSKRCLDVLGAILLLAVSAPFMAVIAILIKFDSPGPVLFRQERVGKGGKRFVFYKFRTMHHGADTSVHRNYVTQFINGGASAIGPVAKLRDDPRITGVGRILRKSSLDELPQLLNVLRGHLSLVGPRPPIPYEVEEYRDWHRRRLDVKPGITGLWQVVARSQASFDQMVELDIKYIEERSLFLDIWILLVTIPAVIGGKGAG